MYIPIVTANEQTPYSGTESTFAPEVFPIRKSGLDLEVPYVSAR